MKCIMTKGVALAAFCLCGLAGIAGAMEHDIRDLQAKLEAQEALLNDLHAKMSGGGASVEEAPDSIISLKKNAKVSIGGVLTNKYTYTRAKIDSRYVSENAAGDPATVDDGSGYKRRAASKGGNFEVSDANLFFQIDVNDHFEARLEMDLHNGTSDDYWIPEVYYVNWKNIRDTGFGVKVGRDALTFGADGVGELGSYAAGGGDGLSELDEGFHQFIGMPIGLPGLGSEAISGAIPLHNGWDISGVTQITPYWEGLDGALSVELSLFNSVYEDTPYASNPNFVWERNGVIHTRSRNPGVGSFAARIGYEPIENLKFTLSAANYRSRGDGDLSDPDVRRDFKATFTRNNFVSGAAVSYRPAFLEALAVWGQWVHGNNVYYYRGMKSDAFNFGASWDFTENLTFFAQGDYLRTTYKQGESDGKGTAWAFYTGLQYSLPYGVSMETGWKHEKVTYKSHGERTGRARADTIYGMVGFEF